MNVITFNEIESTVVANDQVDSVCIEFTTFNYDNVISFEDKKKNKEVLDAFIEIMNTEAAKKTPQNRDEKKDSTSASSMEFLSSRQSKDI